MFLHSYIDQDVVAKSYLPQTFVIVDLETTGFSPDEDEIIEIGAVLVDRANQTQERFHALVVPEREVSTRVAEVTGLSPGLLAARGLNIKEALQGFLAFIKDHRLVFFNAPFDMGFIDKAAERHDLTINNPVSCALRMARQAWPGLPSYKLNQLAKTACMPVDGTHRALRDCELVMQVYEAACNELKRNHE